MLNKEPLMSGTWSTKSQATPYGRSLNGVGDFIFDDSYNDLLYCAEPKEAGGAFRMQTGLPDTH